MRNIIAKAPGQKQVRMRTPTYLGMNLSREEADLMAEQVLTDATSASSDIADGVRLLELTDAIEDMAVIADQMDGELPTTRALIETASRMAVAGTDVEPTEIVPAMECYHGRVAVEGLRAQAEAIWKKVKHSMAGIWDKLDRLIANIVGVYFNVSQYATQTSKELNEALDPAPTNETYKCRQTFFMADAHHAFTSYDDIRNGLMDVHATLKWVLEDYAMNLLAVGDSLTKCMKDFSTDKGELVYSEIETQMRKSISFPGMKKDHEMRNRQGEAYVGEFLPGGVSMVAMVYNAGNDISSRVAALGQHKIELVHSTISGYVAPREVVMKTMVLTEMNTLLGMVDEIAETAERFCKGSFPKRLKAIRHEVDLATTSLYDVNVQSEEDRALVKALKTLAMTFPKWVESPIASVLVYASNFCNAVISTVQQSGEQYATYRDKQRVKQLELENQKLQSHIEDLEDEIAQLEAAQAELEQQVVVVIAVADEEEEQEVGDPSAHG